MKQTPGEDAQKEPSFASFFRFAKTCAQCKYEHEFFYPQKGAYSEADLLKLANMAFKFGQKKDCACVKEEAKPQAT